MHRDPWLAYTATISISALFVLAIFLLGRRFGVVAPMLVAFVSRLAYGLYSLATSGLSVGDTSVYDSKAIDIVLWWRDAGPPPSLSVGKEGFQYLVAATYEVFGHAPEIVAVLNSFAGALTCLVIVSTTTRLGWSDASKAAAWIVALWPVGVLWGGLLLREAIVSLLLALAGWALVTIRRGEYTVGFGVLALAGVAMIPMRGGLAYLILIGLPITVAGVFLISTSVSKAARIAIALLGFALVLVAIPALSGQLGDAQYFDLDRLARSSSSLDRGATSFGNAEIHGAGESTSLIDTVSRTPLILAGPFPWQITNSALFLSGLDAALWMAAWVLGIIGLRRLDDIWAGILLLAPTVSTGIYLSAAATNFGLIIRMRGLMIPLLAPLVAIGLVYLWRKRRSTGDSEHARKRTGAHSIHAFGRPG